MKKHQIFGIAIAMICSSCSQPDMHTYLKKVIKQMESIHSASYYSKNTSWQPGEDEPHAIKTFFIHEYDNPKDTTIGACRASFLPDENMRFSGGYDGVVSLSIYPEHKVVIEDNFTARPLPFRPIGSPFYNKARNILQYALETADSIQTSLMDEDSCYHFSITIYEETQVEFFGKATHLPKPPAEFYTDPVSHYEIWIRKSDNLPFKTLRKMSHNISMEECINPTFNEHSLDEFNLYSYIPEDYEVRKYRVRSSKEDKEKSLELLNKPAPEWTLPDTEDQPVSLKDIKSKIILLNFTGIGCGACQAAIPYLKELKSKYSTNDFELIAIESWSTRTSSRKIYAKRKELNYPMLGATENILKDYQTGRSAPWFFILDENRIIRKIVQGYSLERTGKEISQAIHELMEAK